jgi:signal transduction histidine kinase
MSIRLRLLVSYLAMLIIPLVLFGLAILLLLTVFKGDIKEIWNLSIGDKNAIWFESDEKSHAFHELKQLAESNPDALPAYLTQIENEFKQSHTGAVLRINGQIKHWTVSMIDPAALQKLSEDEQADPKEEIFKRIGNLTYLINRFDFTLKDHSKGNLLFIREINPLVHFAQKFFPLLLIALLIILILTQTLLTYLVSRSIIRPLSQLKKAAQQIKEGNLDFTLANPSRDEIGQLSIAFEEMRFQLKESIEKQLKYEENRKELLSNISHDLKTPITTIKGYANGIHDGIADSPEMLEKYIKIICSQAEGMDHLIDELFLFSKLDLKRIPFHYEQVDIGGFLDDFIEELQFDLEKKNILLTLNLSELRGIKISIDREKFKRVLTNIINNSVKYMDKPIQSLSIQGETDFNRVVIQITDNGQGIQPDALPYIFDRFYRAEQSRNSNLGGSGLGLAIAKQIVEGHEGAIEVKSSFGESTTISIQLPRR